MDKRKIILIISVVLISLGLILFITAKTSQNDLKEKEITSFEKYYTETENSIVFSSREAITDEKEKTLNINPFQKGEITIDKSQMSGDLTIEVIEKSSSNKLNEQIDLLTSNEIIKIEEGLGEYSIKINSKDVSGTYSVKWKIESNNNTELYTSTRGYELKYDSSKFQILNENGKEKFKYVQDENDVYFMVEVIENDKIAEIKNELISSANATGNCIITESNLNGIYTENINGNMKTRSMFFEISEDKMIIIEINQYDEMFENFLIKEHMKNMLKTFKYSNEV